MCVRLAALIGAPLLAGHDSGRGDAHVHMLWLLMSEHAAQRPLLLAAVVGRPCLGAGHSRRPAPTQTVTQCAVLVSLGHVDISVVQGGILLA